MQNLDVAKENREILLPLKYGKWLMILLTCTLSAKMFDLIRILECEKKQDLVESVEFIGESEKLTQQGFKHNNTDLVHQCSTN